MQQDQDAINKKSILFSVFSFCLILYQSAHEISVLFIFILFLLLSKNVWKVIQAKVSDKKELRLRQLKLDPKNFVFEHRLKYFKRITMI